MQPGMITTWAVIVVASLFVAVALALGIAIWVIRKQDGKKDRDR